MDIFRFDKEIKPLLIGYSAKVSRFSKGDFGELERVELEGFNKLVTLEFWSEGWVGVDVFDCGCDQQVMNVLLSPDEENLVSETFERLLMVLAPSA